MRSIVHDLIARIDDVEAREALLEGLGDTPHSDHLPAELLPALWTFDVGQAFIDCHAPMTAEDAWLNKVAMDELLANGDFDVDPGEPPWWEVTWWPFLADGMGQLYCWNAERQEVVCFLHDDPHREVVWEGSLEGFFADQLARVDTGEVIWRTLYGWMTVTALEAIDAYAEKRRQTKARQAEEAAAASQQAAKVWAILLLVVLVLGSVFLLS